MKMRNPSDIELIERLGGAYALAAMLGVRRQVVHNWLYRGQISARQRPQVLDIAREAGIALDEGRFLRLPPELIVVRRAAADQAAA